MTKSRGIQSHPFAVQTIGSLVAQTYEEGDCLIWTGRVCNGVPYAAHNKQPVPVRRLLVELAGGKVIPSFSYGCSCLTPLCVSLEHIVARNARQHSVRMHQACDKSSAAFSLKMAALARKHKAKINIDIAREIRLSEEDSLLLASIHGISRSTVNKIKRNEAWKETSTPFFGLGAR